MTYGKILRYAQNDKVSSYREPQRICYIRKILRSLCSLRMTNNRHSEASDVPCAKNVCVQNINGVICNPKACEILRSLCSLRMTDDGQHEAHSLRMTGVIVCIICVADGNILRNCDILLKIIRVCSYS